MSTEGPQSRPQVRHSLDSNAVARAYLIRHADVLNPHGVLYGHLDNFPLSPKGRLQAAEVGRQLAGAGITRLVHSPLLRAVETAELIDRELPDQVELLADPELREAEFGRYLQGVKPWQVPFRRPLWFVHKARRGLLPGDESIADMGGRILEAVRRHVAAAPDHVIAFVSHADPIQAAWILLEGRPQIETEMYRKSVARAGRLEIELDGDRPVGVTYVPPPEVRAAGTPEPDVPKPA